VAEKAAADNVIVGAVQLEEERLADLESAQLLLPAGLPKVDFVEPIQASQEIEPITIRDSDEEAHVFPCEADQTTAEFYAAPLRFPPRLPFRDLSELAEAFQGILRIQDTERRWIR
jgi:hypothetical protein